MQTNLKTIMKKITLNTVPNCKGYLEYVPTGAGPHPLLICFHGAGEVGTDLGKLEKFGVANHINAGFTPNMIVLMPQWGSNNRTTQQFSGFLKHALTTYNVDKSCIFLTGGSQGGGDIFYALEKVLGFAEQVAAIVPVTPNYPANTAGAGAILKNAIAVMMYVNNGDTAYFPKALAWQGMLSVGGSTLVAFTSSAHNAWDKAHAPDSDMWPWLMKHCKAGRVVTPAPAPVPTNRTIMWDGVLPNGKHVRLWAAPGEMKKYAGFYEEI